MQRAGSLGELEFLSLLEPCTPVCRRHTVQRFLLSNAFAS